MAGRLGRLVGRELTHQRDGKRLMRPTAQGARCRFNGFRFEHLRHVGWQAYRVESYVNWCGHGQEVIPVPRADRLVELVPVLGEAT